MQSEWLRLKAYLHNTPALVKWIYPHWVWDIKSANSIYLTFDDGPHPEATPFVLEELAKYEAKATFFCVGDKVRQFPDIVDSIIYSGHSLGNHTYSHLNGKRSNFDDYIKNVDDCNSALGSYQSAHSPRLFRPPYGKITSRQSQHLRSNYKIIMWDNLIGDFDLTLSVEQCLSVALSNIRSGSIVVFHDSQKALNTLKEVLPEYLKALYSMGLKSKALGTNDLRLI